jgi:hypothetical protein
MSSGVTMSDVTSGEFEVDKYGNITSTGDCVIGNMHFGRVVGSNADWVDPHAEGDVAMLFEEEDDDDEGDEGEEDNDEEMEEEEKSEESEESDESEESEDDSKHQRKSKDKKKKKKEKEKADKKDAKDAKSANRGSDSNSSSSSSMNKDRLETTIGYAREYDRDWLLIKHMHILVNESPDEIARFILMIREYDRDKVLLTFMRNWSHVCMTWSCAEWQTLLKCIREYDRDKVMLEFVKQFPQVCLEWSCSDWQNALRCIREYDRDTLLKNIMRKLPGAHIDEDILGLIRSFDRGSVASVLLEFMERQQVAKAEELSRQQEKTSDMKKRKRDERDTGRRDSDWEERERSKKKKIKREDRGDLQFFPVLFIVFVCSTFGTTAKRQRFWNPTVRFAAKAFRHQQHSRTYSVLDENWNGARPDYGVIAPFRDVVCRRQFGCQASQGEH